MARRRRLRSSLLALMLLVFLNGGGVFVCNDVFDEFRVAASDDLQAGVNQILDGLVDGAFALFEPDDATTGSNADSGADSGNDTQ